MTRSVRLHNARIWTNDRSRPLAASIAWSGDRVTSLDADGACDNSIDGGGGTVLPGLVDAHLHLLQGGLALEHVDLGAVDSREAFESAIDAAHRRLPDDRWLVAGGWSSERWPSGELPDKHWLAAAGERPVVCHRMDMHATLVNDAVLRLCDTARDPAGGRIVRDPRTGEPTGLMVEAAAWGLVNPVIPRPDVKRRREALLEAQSHANARGLTAVCTMEYARDVESVYRPLRDQLTLRCSVVLLDRGWPMRFDFGRDFEHSETLRVIGYKAFIDGTLGSRSARMLEDYADDPGNRGLLIELAADGHLAAWAAAVADAGLTPVMHAIGDEAARLALDAIEPIDPSRRPRIEHAQQVDRRDLRRFAGVIASMQPLHKADDCRYVERRLGRGRLGGTFAFRSLLDAGARLAFGSDWPVVSIDPLEGVRVAVTGRLHDGSIFGAAECLTVDEALRGYTCGAARAAGLRAGMLRPGDRADLVLLDRDPMRIDWSVERPEVLLTVAGGKVVYDRDGPRAAIRASERK